MTTTLARRDLLRLLGLATATAGLAPVLGGCSGSGQDVSTDLGLVSSDVTRAAGDPAAIGDVVTAMSRFAGDLYGRLAAGGGNLALSPYSIVAALGMTVNGAAGRTAEQMLNALRCDGLDIGRLNGGLNALTAHAESLAGTVRRADGSDAELELAAANQLFGDASVTWARAFLDVLAREYGAGMRVVDFVGDTEGARTLVNGWTADQTHDRIPEIIPPGTLDALTRLVLVNALYLKAPWEAPFEKGATRAGAFHRADGSKVQVDLMTGEVGGSLVRGKGWRGVTVPYAGESLAMTVVLPDEGKLAVVEAGVADRGTGPLLTGRSIGDGSVLLTLPKWTFRSKVMLPSLLQALGMTDAFDGTLADFDPMTGQANDFFISAVLHEAFMAVDEEGTEAAAATAVVMEFESAAPVPDELVVDRPFLFVIHDTEHGAPLFVGRVADPSAS